MTSNYRPHIMALFRDIRADRELAEQYEAGDRDPIFARYGVTDEERKILESPSPDTIGSVGLHPIAALAFMLNTTTPIREHHINMGAFLDRIPGQRAAD